MGYMFNFAYSAASLFFIASSLLIVIFMHFDTQYQLGKLQTIKENWRQPTYESIRMFPQNLDKANPLEGQNFTVGQDSAVCPETHPVKLSSFQWVGSSDGCACNKGGYDNHKCCFGNFCDGFTCEGADILPTEPQSLSIWDIGGDPYTLCGRPYPEINMLEINKYMDKDGQCIDPENYELCQTNNKDQNYNFCVPKGKKCPIRSLKILQKEEFRQKNIQSKIPHYKQNDNNKFFEEDEETKQMIEKRQFEEKQIRETYQEQELENGFSLFYSREIDSFPAVQYRVNDGNSICQNESYSDENSKEDFTLLLKKRKIENCKVDSRWQTLSTMVEEDFFAINNGFQNRIYDLKGFQISDHFKYSLLYKTYNPISSQCQVFFDKKKELNFFEFEGNLNYVVSKTQALMISLFIVFMYYAFVDVLFSIDLRPRNHYGIVIYHKSHNKKLTITKLVVFIVKVCLAVFYWGQVFFLNQDCLDLRNACELYIEKNCFLNDIVMKEYLSYVGGDMLRGSLFTYLMGGWWILAVLEPNFTYFVRLKLFGHVDLEYKLPQQQQTQKFQNFSNIEMRSQNTRISQSSNEQSPSPTMVAKSYE